MERKAEGFTDLHSHFLYGLDDGAKTRREMEAMLDAAYADGIAHLYATPHAALGIRPFDGELCARRLEEARAYCRRRGYEMRLYGGAELMYTPAMERFALERRLPTLGDSRRVLMEFVPDAGIRELREAVELVERSGYTAVLAHVERYGCLFVGKNAWKLKEERDVRYQLNAGTAIGGRGLLRGAFVRRWLREGLIDYVASDAHNCTSRPFRMREACASLQKTCGQALAAKLTGLGTQGGEHGDTIGG